MSASYVWNVVELFDEGARRGVPVDAMHFAESNLYPRFEFGSEAKKQTPGEMSQLTFFAPA
ncbi:hypothetical protein TWF694_007199 [Orbilia ellipsospora]|uniref:Uncharacterized protein n=1 Tax=Orbilia ellipsospora TaxID=2528407 RepID=A0AAV9XIM1_9PEZI